jgi:hypothetical protein
MPVAGLQVPASWHWSGLPHVTGAPATQAPATQASPAVQRLPSSQALPSGLLETAHVPVTASHAATVVHGVGIGHTTGLFPMQTPARQVSVCVQAVPSLQAVPSALVGFEHMPVVVLQVPAVWQVSGPGHTTGLAPTQVPVMHVSVCVQALPSLHGTPEIGVQVPLAEAPRAALHAKQSVVAPLPQAELQQTPSTQ